MQKEKLTSAWKGKSFRLRFLSKINYIDETVHIEDTTDVLYNTIQYNKTLFV